MAKTPKGIATERIYGEFTYRFTIDETPVSGGDYIYDFVNANWGKCPIIQCDSDGFVELVNKDIKKPMHERRAAKIVASNDPVLNLYGIPRL